MTSMLSLADQEKYTKVIDELLLTADLENVTAKQIRKLLSVQVGKDLTYQKKIIQDLILERFSRAINDASGDAQVAVTSPTENVRDENFYVAEKEKRRVKRESDNDTEDDIPQKKRRIEKSKSPTPLKVDEKKYAKVLQSQASCNRETRAVRATTKSKNKLKTTQEKKDDTKKSGIRAKDSDYSEVQASSDDEYREEAIQKNGGFHKPYQLSAPLAELLGESTLSRPHVVKNIWKYIKANNLQDPNDKRQIICDKRMKSVFKKDRVHMFTMNKILGRQLYDVEEE